MQTCRAHIACLSIRRQVQNGTRIFHNTKNFPTDTFIPSFFTRSKQKQASDFTKNTPVKKLKNRQKNANETENYSKNYQFSLRHHISAVRTTQIRDRAHSFAVDAFQAIGHLTPENGNVLSESENKKFY